MGPLMGILYVYLCIVMHVYGLYLCKVSLEGGAQWST
jgi:hypothetical protein